jgi:hypothetical protein
MPPAIELKKIKKIYGVTCPKFSLHNFSEKYKLYKNAHWILWLMSVILPIHETGIKTQGLRPARAKSIERQHLNQ